MPYIHKGIPKGSFEDSVGWSGGRVGGGVGGERVKDRKAEEVKGVEVVEGV